MYRPSSASARGQSFFSPDREMGAGGRSGEGALRPTGQSLGVATLSVSLSLPFLWCKLPD